MPDDMLQHFTIKPNDTCIDRIATELLARPADVGESVYKVVIER